jgi:nitrate reductase NapA
MPPHVMIAVLSTFTNCSSDLAELPMVFRPGTDLAILNYIANHIISSGRVHRGTGRRSPDLGRRFA